MIRHNDTSEVGSRISVEDTLSSSVAPEAPAMESFRSSFKTMLPPTEHSSKAQVAILEQFEQAEALQAVQASVQNDLPLTMLSQPKSERTTDVGQSLPANTSESHATGNLSLPPISQPPPAEQVERDAQVSFADFDPRTSQKETGKQRRKREAEEIRQREEQERRDQESFEQYRIDQERLEMKRLEQKRLEREKSRQERIERERIEQERLNRERIEQERANEERVKKEKLEKARLEQQRLEEERLREERLKQEKLKQEKLEQERLEQERLEQERLEQERLEQERLEQERLEQERLEEKRIEQQILEQQRLDVQRQQEEKINKRRLEEQQIGDNALESKGVEKEAAAATEAVELSREDIHQAETEAADRFETQHIQPSTLAQKSMGEMTSGPTTELLASPGVQQRRVFNQATIEPAQQPTPHSQASSYPPITSNDMRTSNPASRLPTPAASVGRGNSPHSMTMEAPKTRVSQAPSPTMSAHGSRDVESATHSRHTTSSPALPAPRPQAVSQIIDDSRPPAPSPPVGRVRPRHIPAFDSDDESDSAMVRPRRQFRGGEEFSRDGSSGSAQGYPPQPTHHRSVFASRVPAEPSYSNPPPPQPPGYHPGYYPSTAPPHYQNHNYRVSQPGYPHPNTYGPPSHSSSSPYTEPWNYPPGYRHDSPPQRHDTLVTRDYSLGLDTRPALGDDPGDVFSRISQAIPDLHVLLARYKETHGQLSVREELLRRSSVEQEERLRVKDDEIAELKERARTLEHKYSTEASRLRFQIGNLEEEARELQEQRIETAKFKKEAQDTKSALEAAMKSWEAKYKELEEAHAALARTSAEEKADFDEWKSSYTTRNDAEKIALAIQFDKRLKEADVLAESQRQDAIAIHVQEKDELQASFDKTRNELETKLGSAQQDREEALRHERESREIWLAEREALIKSHQDDRESIRRGWDEQRGLLEAHYKKSKDESDRAWIDLHADASQKANEEKARVDELIKEKEELQKKYNALKAESEKEKAIIKSVASNLESEKSRLEKLMECYGDIAEIKSKGDTY
jgi:serine/arginine repetitive matrix protein 2